MGSVEKETHCFKVYMNPKRGRTFFLFSKPQPLHVCISETLSSSSTTSSSASIHPGRTSEAVPPLSFQSVWLVEKSIPDAPPVGAGRRRSVFVSGEPQVNHFLLLLPHLLLFLMCPQQQRGDSAQLGTRVKAATSQGTTSGKVTK